MWRNKSIPEPSVIRWEEGGDMDVRGQPVLSNSQSAQQHRSFRGNPTGAFEGIPAQELSRESAAFEGIPRELSRESQRAPLRSPLK